MMAWGISAEAISKLASFADDAKSYDLDSSDRTHPSGIVLPVASQ